jgi:hypothetical protein
MFQVSRVHIIKLHRVLVYTSSSVIVFKSLFMGLAEFSVHILNVHLSSAA